MYEVTKLNNSGPGSLPFVYKPIEAGQDEVVEILVRLDSDQPRL